MLSQQLTSYRSFKLIGVRVYLITLMFDIKCNGKFCRRRYIHNCALDPSYISSALEAGHERKYERNVFSLGFVSALMLPFHDSVFLTECLLNGFN